jgi:hypothetical protein
MEPTDTSIPLPPGSRLDHAEVRGSTTWVPTRLDFKSLCKEREVQVEAAGILRERGVLGSAGAGTFFDAEAWEEASQRCIGL